MEFREKQIEMFIEQAREIAKTIGMVPSPHTGNMIEEDEYISGIIGEVEERLIDLSSARITILNYLNQQVDHGNGEAFNRMREEFLKINLWYGVLKSKYWVNQPSMKLQSIPILINQSSMHQSCTK